MDRQRLEMALLFRVVQEKCFEKLIEYEIDETCFTESGKLLYNFVFEYIEKYKDYPTLPVLMDITQLTLDDITVFNNYGDIQFLIDNIKDKHLSDVIQNEIIVLNSSGDKILNQPREYINIIGDMYDKLKLIGVEKKSINLLGDIQFDKLEGDKNTAIKSGFAELDNMLGGWNRGEDMIVLMGRPGQGKSFLGLKFSLEAALQYSPRNFNPDGTPQLNHVGIYSGEMSGEQVLKRLICLNRHGRQLISSKESYEEMQHKGLQLSLVTQSELQGRATVRDLEAMIIRDKLDFLFVDQLSLMDDVHQKVFDTRTRYANISSDLFTLSTKYKLPIVLAVQSNRDGAMQKDAPQLENIAESDAVGQNATRVIGMRRESTIMSMNISKNRYGDDTFMQKYDVQFDIGKFTPIVTDVAQRQDNSSRDRFGRSRDIGTKF